MRNDAQARGRDDDLEAGVRHDRRARSGSRASHGREGRSVAGAAFLSFIWPGLGQLYAGRRWRAFLFAVPALLLVVGVLIAVLRSPEVFALRLLVPSFAYGIVGVIALHGLWRVAAIVDTWIAAGRRTSFSGRALPLVLVLSLLVVGSHAVAGYYVYSFAGAGDRIFTGDDPSDGTTDALDEIIGGGPRPTPGDQPGDQPGVHPGVQPSLTPRPQQSIARDQPINVLFVGVDSEPGRDHALTDTLIVVSFDPQANDIVMISVPRDTGRIPMFDGTTYNDRINSLMGHFRQNPERYREAPIHSLMRQMGYLIGIPMHYYAVTDMNGLREVVDLVGGVDVMLERRINDVRMGLVMEPGPHHLDGDRALMYVRSRYGPGNSDFVRARRQQQVIRALANRVKDPAVLVRLREVVEAGARFVRSDVPVDQFPEVLDLIDRSETATQTQIVLAPPKYARRIPPNEVGGRYMIELDMDAVAALSVELFGARSRYWAGGTTPEVDHDPH